MRLFSGRVCLFASCLAVLSTASACFDFSDASPSASNNASFNEEERDRWFSRSLHGSIYGSVAEEEVSDAIPTSLEPKELIPDFVTRGAYLTRVAACGSCHAAVAPAGPRSGDAPLVGGRLLKDSAGEVHAPNLTPVSPGGLGDWNLQEIVLALRSAIGKDNEPLSLDVHKSYRWISDVDALAIASYLKSLPAIRNDVSRRTLGTFDRSSLGLVSKHQATYGYVPSPSTSSVKETGRYLTNSITACGSCHTPEPSLFSDPEPLSGREPSASPIEFPRGGPDIRGSSAEGLKSWSKMDIVNYLQSGKTPSGRKVDGAACPWPYFQSLTAKDKERIADYLKGL